MYAVFVTLSFLAVTLSASFYLLKIKLQYWKRKNVQHLRPRFILGNFAEYIFLNKYIGQVTQKLCQEFPEASYFGAYYGTEPALIIQDPELIKLVMTKDFYYFSGREISKYTHKEVLTKNIFFSGGDGWKVVRQNLTPLFSSAKMRNMFHLIEKCANIFESILDNETSISDVLEIKGLMSRYTIDCIGSCAFGIDTRAMEQDSQNAFRNVGDLIFASTNYRGFKIVTRAIWPAIFYGLGFKSFPKEIEAFFSKLLTGIFQGRNYQPSSRNDFVDLVLGFKKNKHITGDSLSNMKTGAGTGRKVEVEVDNELLVAQCITFFAAGFETSATTLTFTLYELAKNQEAQQRAQQEVDEYMRRHKNKLNYDCVSELPYVEACTDEALRMYPVLGVLTRETVEDYTFPSGLHLEKGVRVHVPVYHLHHNPEHFPEPDEYRPERFLAHNKHDIKPYTYIPFGEGPRICIGMRFAKMQMLAGLVTLLKKYRVKLATDMPRNVEIEPRTIVTQPVGGVHLKFEPREGWQERVFTTQTI